MMGNYYGPMMGGAWGGWGTWWFFCIFTWILLVVFLVLGIAYFWRELNKKGR